MTLTELIIAVKEKNLTKDELENYRDQMSVLFAEMQIEMAELEKSEAIFTDNYPLMENGKPESAAARKIAWKGTQSGQRLIVLKRYATATKEMLSSLRNRLFQIY